MLIFVKYAILFLFTCLSMSVSKDINYEFTFDKFKPFYSGEKFLKIQKLFKEIQLVKRTDKVVLYKIYIMYEKYKFPLFFQIQDGVVIDFYAKLPSYFIHDIFHQSLIDKFGVQNKFFNKDSTSIYIWKEVKGMTFTYEASCTITCFPVFLHGISNKNDEMAKNSFLNRLKKSQKNEILL